MGLWYPKDSGFELIAYSDADHAGYKDDCKSTSGGLQFLGGKLSLIAISCNPVQHSKTKHIDIQYHFIKEHVEEQEDGSSIGLRFMLDKKELSLTLDDFRTIFHLPQANAVNHDTFVTPPSFLDMVPFYKQQLGFTMELKTSSSFKTTGLLQPWQTLCKIFSKCLTTRVTGWDQPLLQIMQMLYCFVNNIHVEYAELLWEGLYFSLHHPTSSIPYPRFTKIIISHYMTSFPKISRCAQDRYHSLKDDDIMKNIFNLGRYKDKVGMQIPDWMILEEMKHTEHYRMYAEVFELDVPLTQSQPTESTQGTHRTPSAPRNDEPKIPGTRLEPRSDKESPEVEITKDKEVEITNDKEVRMEKRKIVEESRSTPFPTPIRSPMIHTDLVSSDTEKLQDLTVTDTTPSSRSPSTNLSKTNILLSLFKATPARFKQYKNFFQGLQGRYTYLFEHLKARFLSRKSFDTLADHLQETKEEMERMIAKAIFQEHGNIQAEISSQIQKTIDNHIPSQVDASLQQQDIAIWLALQMKSESLQVPQTTCRSSAIRPRDQDDPHDDAHPEGIVARRANECIVSITEPDYKNLNKNDIKDMYLLIMNGKVPDYAETGLLWSLSVFIRSSVLWERVHDFQLGIESYQQKVNLTAPTISFPGVEKHKMFSIIYEPVHGIIYKNSKKEKRVMRHLEIHKDLTNEEVEYLKLFEEEIEVRLKYRNQMRRWEMYVNGRPLGPRRERPK
ncbi:retrovirus-related pol polyprotein from transposon TNT 1-94 [Tanacetum coccineum]|uniref:Retrovirus-related pol polyprotein from transposon TNT 1-94 n=1 Tax=Tanacetum coccineum TaxID=301880 RepID=A0ABQ4WK18_9ASTR